MSLLLAVHSDNQWESDSEVGDMNNYSCPFRFHCIAKHHGKNGAYGTLMVENAIGRNVQDIGIIT